MSEQELRAQEIMDTYGHEWMAERIAELEAENDALSKLMNGINDELLKAEKEIDALKGDQELDNLIIERIKAEYTYSLEQQEKQIAALKKGGEK